MQCFVCNVYYDVRKTPIFNGRYLCPECYVGRAMGKSFTTKEVEASVRSFGTNGAHVTLPKDWIGKRVRITVIEE